MDGTNCLSLSASTSAGLAHGVGIAEGGWGHSAGALDLQGTRLTPPEAALSSPAEAHLLIPGPQGSPEWGPSLLGVPRLPRLPIWPPGCHLIGCLAALPASHGAFVPSVAQMIWSTRRLEIVSSIHLLRSIRPAIRYDEIVRLSIVSYSWIVIFLRLNKSRIGQPIIVFRVSSLENRQVRFK